MARYLATFNDNHNEEFDVYGFKIMTDKEISKLEELASSVTWNFEFYANKESLSFVNGDDLLSRISFREISKDEYDTIKKVFNGEFGLFIGEEYLQTIIEDDAVDETDEMDEDEDY